MGFSNKEVDHFSKVVRFHMKPSQPAFNDQFKKDIRIHRFFRKSGSAGILVGIIHLADVLATYEETLSEDRWDRAVSSVDNIFDAYFNRVDEIVMPPRIITGKDIINEFNLKPGKKIGALLDQVAEAQVVGAVINRKGAIEYIDKLININQEN
jgi:poly(A) polymerase